uniref:Tail specific protease domain-containing protein n=1 Tax=Chromera velia CCMP2878 TaxID=1169474 RepID=A0A0G4I027_9ALVE|eukprot:Cvel_9853.t1-p1 / transcript=Cvel_9853.t1 / gene=Cvel_9853 / organism=Chromera_velia_CCMP2878 / gene_product=hypothetical protein / transcript_product=hypothetical protein / location=Cvel_scaffold580:24821-28005(-) / protein_length=916 / sequence_SO=supercontig / SO=protein_coding / is_pseudo=false
MHAMRHGLVCTLLCAALLFGPAEASTEPFLQSSVTEGSAEAGQQHETPTIPPVASPSIEAPCVYEQYIDLETAVRCYNEKYRVPASVAYETVRDLSKTMEEFYAFWGLSDNPLASNQVNKANPFPVFGEKSPPGRNFAAVLQSIPTEQGATVGIQEVSSKVNELIISLRDEHLEGLTAKIFNGETGGLFLTLTIEFVYKNRRWTDWLSKVRVATPLGETPYLSMFETYRGERVELQVKQIEGQPAFDWLIENTVKPSIFDSAAHKPIGTRTNAVLGMNFGGRHTSAFGDIGQLKTGRFPAAITIVGEDGESIDQVAYLEWKAKIKTEYCPNVEKAQKRGKASEVLHSILDIIEGREGMYRNYTTAADFLHTLPNRLLAPPPQSLPPRSGFLRPPSLLEVREEGRAVSSPQDDKKKEKEEPKIPPSNATHIFDSKGTLIGRTRCEEEQKYCVLSLRSFSLKHDDYPNLLNAWDSMAAVARNHGIEKLILDVNENGGGTVQLAYAFLAKIFPSAPGDKICPYLRIRLGPLSRLLSRHGLLGDEGRAARQRALNDREVMQRTVEDWKKKDCERGLGKHDSFKAALKGILYFIEDVYDPEIDDMSEGEIDWIKETLKKKDINQRFQEAVDKCADRTLDRSTLKRVASSIDLILQVWTPFERKIDYVGSEWKLWGGAKRLYTRPLTNWLKQCTSNFGKNEDQVVHPFKKILIFSSGMGCISSCDTFASSAREWSRANPSVEPSVKFLTWGGASVSSVAKESVLSGTTAQGGFVKGENMQNRLWVWFALFRWFAETTGSELLLPELDKVEKLLPPVPYAMEKTPRLTRAAGFQTTWGMDSLPAEYYKVPTDFTLPAWFNGLSREEWLEVDGPGMNLIYGTILPYFDDKLWGGKEDTSEVRASEGAALESESGEEKVETLVLE